MSWERARTLEQKETRMEEVLTAARRLLLRKGFEAVSLSHIASEVSFGRSNLYKYFESKEEIYLKLLAREIEQFGRRLIKSMGPGETAAEDFAGVWTEHLKKEKVMLMLMSMAGTILEKNCSDVILVESKTAMARASAESFIPFVQDFFPHLGEETAAELLKYLIVVANGLYPFSGLSNRQKQILNKEGLGSMVHDFDETYKHMITDRLRGLNNSRGD